MSIFNIGEVMESISEIIYDEAIIEDIKSVLQAGADDLQSGKHLPDPADVHYGAAPAAAELAFNAAKARQKVIEAITDMASVSRAIGPWSTTSMRGPATSPSPARPARRRSPPPPSAWPPLTSPPAGSVHAAGRLGEWCLMAKGPNQQRLDSYVETVDPAQIRAAASAW